MMKVVYKKDVYLAEKTENYILKILAYFSVFNYPLTKDDIRRFLHPGANPASLDVALKYLVTEKCIYKIDEFYLLQDDPTLVTARRDGNLRAEKLLPRAIKIGKFLSGFPYVTGIGISGSLSKKYAHDKADIDFFIITKANRLWIARTFMHLFKKLTFITGKQHYYCMNYYLDEKALRLRDHTIYTAMEIFTLIPVKGEGLPGFYKANDWVSEWFASYSPAIEDRRMSTSKPVIRRMAEWMFNNKVGDKLDNYLMRMTTRRWRKKEQLGKRNYEGKEMALVTGKHYAWSNPDSFQEKIVTLYNKKLAELQTKWPAHFEEVSFSFEK